MERDDSGDYRFASWRLANREGILEREADRIEQERYAPPSGDLSEAVRLLLRRIASGERVEVDGSNRPTFRELAADRALVLGHTFAKGAESGYRLTYWDLRLRFELAEIARAKETARQDACHEARAVRGWKKSSK